MEAKMADHGPQPSLLQVYTMYRDLYMRQTTFDPTVVQKEDESILASAGVSDIDPELYGFGGDGLDITSDKFIPSEHLRVDELGKMTIATEGLTVAGVNDAANFMTKVLGMPAHEVAKAMGLPINDVVTGFEQDLGRIRNNPHFNAILTNFPDGPIKKAILTGIVGADIANDIVTIGDPGSVQDVIKDGLFLGMQFAPPHVRDELGLVASALDTYVASQLQPGFVLTPDGLLSMSVGDRLLPAPGVDPIAHGALVDQGLTPLEALDELSTPAAESAKKAIAEAQFQQGFAFVADSVAYLAPETQKVVDVVKAGVGVWLNPDPTAIGTLANALIEATGLPKELKIAVGLAVALGGAGTWMLAGALSEVLFGEEPPKTFPIGQANVFEGAGLSELMFDPTTGKIEIEGPDGKTHRFDPAEGVSTLASAEYGAGGVAGRLIFTAHENDIEEGFDLTRDFAGVEYIQAGFAADLDFEAIKNGAGVRWHIESPDALTTVNEHGVDVHVAMLMSSPFIDPSQTTLEDLENGDNRGFFMLTGNLLANGTPIIDVPAGTVFSASPTPGGEAVPVPTAGWNATALVTTGRLRFAAEFLARPENMGSAHFPDAVTADKSDAQLGKEFLDSGRSSVYHVDVVRPQAPEGAAPETVPSPYAGLYRLNPDATVSVEVQNVLRSNEIVTRPDGSRDPAPGAKVEQILPPVTFTNEDEARRFLSEVPDLLAWIASDPERAPLLDTSAGLRSAYDQMMGVKLANPDGDAGIVFDAMAYMRANPDVGAALNYDALKATKHYVEFGRHEGRDMGLYEVAGEDGTQTVLRTRMENVPGAALQMAAEQFAVDENGQAIGVIDPLWSNLQAIGGMPLPRIVFRDQGQAQDFAARIDDVMAWIASDPSRAGMLSAEGGLLAAYEAVAAGEVPSFDAEAYLAANPDVRETLGSSAAMAAMHYVEFGIAEGRPLAPPQPAPLVTRLDGTALATPTLDDSAFAADFAARLPEILALVASDPARAAAIGDPATLAGAYADLLAGAAPSFDASAYLAANPDVAAVLGEDPVKAAMHYIEFGMAEGRSMGAPAGSADIVEPGSGDQLIPGFLGGSAGIGLPALVVSNDDLVPGDAEQLTA
ncbi:hypothetical protein GCM10011322_10230 [Salinarimonas ramus]|uniref:Uncharacterized protein n=2 Tax=Salinarimonas ramus TaxID=690164 RepID=A0A917V2P2_9HYPH|nr:hypothetical protein GCM10011322_10230 [Salinarimonas ramus]